jgi:hypothetical protein
MLLPAVLFDMTVIFVVRAILAVARLLRATVTRLADATPAESEINLLSAFQLFVVVQQISD